jgi:hypothetical protein
MIKLRVLILKFFIGGPHGRIGASLPLLPE